MSCGVGCRQGSDPTLLWLWRRPESTAPIRPLAWEPPCASGAAQEMAKRQGKKKKKLVQFFIPQVLEFLGSVYSLSVLLANWEILISLFVVPCLLWPVEQMHANSILFSHFCT